MLSSLLLLFVQSATFFPLSFSHCNSGQICSTAGLIFRQCYFLYRKEALHYTSRPVMLPFLVVIKEKRKWIGASEILWSPGRISLSLRSIGEDLVLMELLGSPTIIWISSPKVAGVFLLPPPTRLMVLVFFDIFFCLYLRSNFVMTYLIIGRTTIIYI